MLKQLFRKNIPAKYLFELLEQICAKTGQYYEIDHNSYRKLKYHGLDHVMRDDLVEFYHESKQFYITRDMTYRSFTNIIRHICKSSNIPFTTKLKYNESNYNIKYYIYYEGVLPKGQKLDFTHWVFDEEQDNDDINERDGEPTTSPPAADTPGETI